MIAKNLLKTLLWVYVGGCTGLSATKITEQDVLTVLERWEEAYKTRDTEVMEEILDDQWFYAGSGDGSLSSKKATIEELRTADYQFLSMDLNDLDINYFSDIAVVRGRELLSMRLANGDTLRLKLRFTDVYKKTGGITRAISTHSSPVE